MDDTNSGLEHFLPAIEMLKDAVLFFDLSGRLIGANPAAQSLFEISKQAVPEHITILFQDWPEILSIYSDPGSSLPAAVEINFRDETSYDVQMIKHEWGCWVSLHDVTRFNNRAQTRASFIHTIVHDLRSPLTSILGYVDLMGRAGALNETQHDFKQRVIHSVQQINSLINDLQVLAACESSQRQPREKVQVKAAAKKAADALEKQFKPRKLELEMNIPDAVEVCALPGEIKILLEKLLENAVQYSPPDEKVCLNCSIQQNMACIEISDMGPGIPESEKDLIFTHFYRGSNVSSSTEGTGLGLSIVQAILDNHGGKISVKSSPGEGSTFTVYLPVCF